jgi:hypothetical protein
VTFTACLHVQRVVKYAVDSRSLRCLRNCRTWPATKNLGTLFQKIASAKIPPKFSHDFLQTTLGLKSTNDRAFIPFLRNLGFLDQSGTPTASYALLKGDKQAAAIAAGVRTAYAPLFTADENANDLSGEKLRSLVAQVAGTDDDMTGRIASTFNALAKLGDFKTDTKPPGEEKNKVKEKEDEGDGAGAAESGQAKKMRTEFHYNIQIHLPANATEETYQNIFNDMRKTFQ